MRPVEDGQLLGRGILARLSELREPGRMDAFLLYLGRGSGPLIIHRRRALGGVGESRGYSERFTLGTDGTLYYGRTGLGNCEPGPEVGELGIPMKVEEDFRRLDYESVLALHDVVMREAFFDDLAYRLDRDGRVGYGDVFRLHPEEEVRESRRLRLR